MRRASVVFSGGSAERVVLEHFDELAARAEQEHRPELRINAAAEDDFVAVAQLDHRLHGDALEMFLAGLFGAGGLDGLERRASRRPRPCRFNCTPPTSVLCVMVSEYSFSTMGKPISVACFTASASVVAICVSTVGMP